MKIFNYKSLLATAFLTLISAVQLLADNNHPPTPNGSGGLDDGVVVGGPIDDFIPLLFLLAMVFGAIMITKIKSKKLIVESI